MMGVSAGPTGHLQVRRDKNGRGRSYHAFWRDADGKHGSRLGPAHVKDTGRRTPRGAIIWRAADGLKPTPEHLTPRDAQAWLDELLAGATCAPGLDENREESATLRQAVEGWLAERQSEKGLKRSTVASYDDMFERLYRDLGADTPVRAFADGRLRVYFADFESCRVLGESAARQALTEGRNVRRVAVERWTAQPPDSVPIEVTTKAEAERLAAELPGTWKHRRRGAYRVVPLNAQRPRRVSHATAETLEGEGWIIARRKTRRWMLITPAAAQTRNAYRDILAASLDYAVRQRWLDANPLAEIKRMSKRHERQRILRRDDFYDREEVSRLLEHAPGAVEVAFWLCGADAGLRFPGEGLGLHWGAVDFHADVVRPYDNWVRNDVDTTKTSDSEAIPMTPRLRRALSELKQRGYAADDGDFVFVSELEPDRPVSDRPLREAFKVARATAGLKPIKMYNLRHSFDTTLASKGMDVRTIQALMRHDRLTTTEQYMAYAPRPELASQITRALDPQDEEPAARPVRSGAHRTSPTTFLERLEEEIPARWLHEVQRLYIETVA